MLRIVTYDALFKTVPFQIGNILFLESKAIGDMDAIESDKLNINLCELKE